MLGDNMDKYIVCPCCNHKISVQSEDDFQKVVFFDEDISHDELFDKYDICVGLESEVK